MPKTDGQLLGRIIALVVGLLLAAPAAGQTTYFVRTTGSNGNDGRTPATAFATVAYGMDRLRAGDTLVVGAGVYTGRVLVNVSGTAAAPIRVIADTSGTQTGDSGEVVLRSSGAEALRVRDRQHIEFVGFTMDGNAGTRVAWIDERAIVGLNRCIIRNAQTGVEIGRDAQVTLTACTLESFSQQGVGVIDGSLIMRGGSISNARTFGIAVRNMRTTSARGQIEGVRITSSLLGILNQNAAMSIDNCVLDGCRFFGVYNVGASASMQVRHTAVRGSIYGMRSAQGRVDIHNSLFVQNRGRAVESSQATVTTTNIGYWQNAVDVFGPVTRQGTDITEDPLVNDWEAFTLAPLSPLIDAGAMLAIGPGSDMFGTVRPIGPVPDIGPVEQQHGLVVADLPYSNDFESDIGDEWTDQRASQNEEYSRFLGRHGRESRTINGRRQTVHSETTLRVRTVPGERYYFVFDLLVIDSWDADSTRWGPDRFEVLLDGTQFRSGYLSRASRWMGVIEEGMSGSGRRGFGGWDDATLRGATFDFIATRPVTQITWRGLPNQGINDESWGIDNVQVFHEDEAEQRLPLFTDVTLTQGFNHRSTDSDARPAAVHWFDADGDGHLDAMLGGAWARLLRWNGSGFTEVWGTSRSLPFGHAIIDVDNDGDLDIAVARGPGNAEGVYINPGNGVFSNASFDPMDLNWPSGGEAVLAADLNRDGWIDLFFPALNGNWAAINRPSPDAPRDEVERIFEEQTELEMGLHLPGSYGDGNFASSADWNDDGQLDFLSHFNGGWAFASNPDRRSWTESQSTFAMTTGDTARTGSAWGDYDNDGDLDVWIGSQSPTQRGRLYRNTPAGFVDVAESAGLTLAASHAGAAWGDVDNDGDLDLYIATFSGANLLYQNEGDGTFTLIDRGAAIFGAWHDACFADYDGDGDVDLAISGRNVPATLLRNNTDDARGVRVRVRGAGAGGTNAAGVGVRIDLRDPDGRFLQRRDLGLARGFGGTEPLEAHFGGIEPGVDYELWVYLARGVTRVPFTGGDVRTEINGQTFERLLVVTETDILPIRQIVRWGEMGPDETSLVRDGRGLMERGPAMRRAGGLDATGLAEALRNEGIDDQAIERIGRRAPQK